MLILTTLEHVMADAYKEITVWEDGNTAINHTYLLEGDMMLGYMRTGTSVPFYFKNPIRISKSGRKFEKLEDNPFDTIFSVVVPQETSNNIKEIEGSKGAKYILDVDAKTCTCPGFTYRGTCKHVKELETQ
jgi:SWIM zinc finger